MDKSTAEFVTEYMRRATQVMGMSQDELLDFCEKITPEYGAKMRAVVKEAEEVLRCQ